MTGKGADSEPQCRTISASRRAVALSSYLDYPITIAHGVIDRHELQSALIDCGICGVNAVQYNADLFTMVSAIHPYSIVNRQGGH